MNRTWILLLALWIFLPPAVFGQTTSVRKVAILETVDRENTVGYGVKLMVRSKLAYAVTATPGYEGYDRVDMAAILGEHNFQRTGMVSDSDIKKLGEMTGAAYILIAEVAKLDPAHLVITAKILDVETARLDRTADATSGISADELQTSCRELAVKLFGGRDTGGTTVILGNRSGSTTGQSGNSYVEDALGLNMKMIYVEGGEFLMGATSEQGSDAYDDERNVRRIRLDSYYIGECEVTQVQWTKVMGTSIQQQASKAGFSDFRGIGPDYPMYYVSWEEAQAFCQELSRITGRTYLLPTEAQWEYAARGGKKNDGTKYSGSWSIDAVAWYDGNSGRSTHPVKGKRANGLGLYDMSGNVWEWCADWYSSSYNTNETNNPVGASSGSDRVLRGGSWGNSARNCRVSFRGSDGPGYRYYSYGFRVVVLL